VTAKNAQRTHFCLSVSKTIVWTRHMLRGTMLHILFVFIDSSSAGFIYCKLSSWRWLQLCAQLNGSLCLFEVRDVANNHAYVKYEVYTLKLRQVAHVGVDNRHDGINISRFILYPVEQTTFKSRLQILGVYYISAQEMDSYDCRNWSQYPEAVTLYGP
jgi:hypothetical protein